jgi:hypothetical protein
MDYWTIVTPDMYPIRPGSGATFDDGAHVAALRMSVQVLLP